MFSNVALDVSIGLVFIFLIYSLLATIVQEMVARLISMRGRMLIKGVRVMLEDRQDSSPNVPIFRYVHTLITAAYESIRNFYKPFPEESLAKKFYEHPNIKYLSESVHNNKPSYIGPVNFSDTMIKLLRGASYDGTVAQMDAIKKTLGEWQAKLEETQPVIDGELKKLKKTGTILVKLNDQEMKLGIETLHYLQQMVIDAQNDVERFRALLEDWFGHTMDRVNGWYKKQTQTVLLLIGLSIACAFNVDTISIYHVLAKDKKARESLVQMAIDQHNKMGTVVENVKPTHVQVPVDTTINGQDTTMMRDSSYIAASGDYFDSTYKELENDAADADKILGLGKPYSDKMDSLKGALANVQGDSVQIKNINANIAWLKARTCKLQYGPKQKGGWYTLAGWIITALAISLGAPFWFDLLNKLIALRSSGKKSDNAPDNSNNTNGSNAGTSPLKTVG